MQAARTGCTMLVQRIIEKDPDHAVETDEQGDEDSKTAFEYAADADRKEIGYRIAMAAPAVLDDMEDDVAAFFGRAAAEFGIK